MVLPRDIGGALLLGIVIAGVIGVLVPQNGWEAYLGSGILSIVAMMLLGVPLYVCASASVPIAAGLIHAGASPGAALAFLISGPASNPATITTVWKLLGRRTALLYLAAVAISAIGGGLLLGLAHARHARGGAPLDRPRPRDHARGLARRRSGPSCCWRCSSCPTRQSRERRPSPLPKRTAPTIFNHRKNG